MESSPDDFSYGDIDTEEENDNETFSKMKVHSKKVNLLYFYFKLIVLNSSFHPMN